MLSNTREEENLHQKMEILLCHQAKEHIGSSMKKNTVFVLADANE